MSEESKKLYVMLLTYAGQLTEVNLARLTGFAQCMAVGSTTNHA